MIIYKNVIRNDMEDESYKKNFVNEMHELIDNLSKQKYQTSAANLNLNSQKMGQQAFGKILKQLIYHFSIADTDTVLTSLNLNYDTKNSNIAINSFEDGIGLGDIMSGKPKPTKTPKPTENR